MDIVLTAKTPRKDFGNPQEFHNHVLRTSTPGQISRNETDKSKVETWFNLTG